MLKRWGGSRTVHSARVLTLRNPDMHQDEDTSSTNVGGEERLVFPERKNWKSETEVMFH